MPLLDYDTEKQINDAIDIISDKTKHIENLYKILCSKISEFDHLRTCFADVHDRLTKLEWLVDALNSEGLEIDIKEGNHEIRTRKI